MKRLLPLLLALAVLAGCSAPVPEAEGDGLHILATTYPVYLFTTAVTEDVEGVSVTLLVNSQTSCLHDYTLTVGNMKAIEAADIIVENGGGLEEFMATALEHSDATVIDCSLGLPLLPAEEHSDHGHDHGEEHDPHFWMDPMLAARMAERIAAELGELDAPNRARYQENAGATAERLAELCAWAEDVLADCPRNLVTFHDGFQYFANAFDLHLLMAIEEEDGAAASARELETVISLVTDYQLPGIFVEKDGSSVSARVIAQETGCGVGTLDMLMSGDGAGIQPYLDAMRANLQTVLEVLG